MESEVKKRMSETKDDLELTEELFAFLQGEIPDGYTISKRNVPKLTADQAWTVIWYLGNEYWQVPDFIERCDLCGNLFHTHREGACLDYGKAPYDFCDNCMNSQEYDRKARRNPDREWRKTYIENNSKTL
jgi:hypothetical protein